MSSQNSLNNFTIYGCLFLNNIGINGGACKVIGNRGNFISNKFIGNEAIEGGGALYIDTSGKFFIIIDLLL